MRKLLLGGSGRLGRELRRRLPDLVAPGSDELNLAQAESLARGLDELRPGLVVNCAAFTDVARAEQERAECWAVNAAGVANLVRALEGTGAMLVQISTDYVFSGTSGGYGEDDTPGPTRNYYALTKLVGEQIALSYRRSLVVRTSFRDGPWPYPVAFDDLYTSQDYLDVLAPDLALAVERAESISDRILHIATERKSAYELARRRRPEVRPGSRREAAVELPADVSLNCQRWQAWKRKWEDTAEGGDPPRGSPLDSGTNTRSAGESAPSRSPLESETKTRT